MEHDLKTDVPNIHDKYHQALYKDFVFIEENVKKIPYVEQKYCF